MLMRDRLAEYVEQNHLTLQEASRRLKVPINTLSRILRWEKDYRPWPSTTKKVEEALDRVWKRVPFNREIASTTIRLRGGSEVSIEADEEEIVIRIKR